MGRRIVADSADTDAVVVADSADTDAVAVPDAADTDAVTVPDADSAALSDAASIAASNSLSAIELTVADKQSVVDDS